ncbi:hypothetical protein WN944_022554 [Citrus x changshan-huyou]|uniref:Uncharacterized protein n=1 Tax=Citrus x changshan-huyou TaxID=2935761 RepID=A0AAP0R394_9ROSI
MDKEVGGKWREVENEEDIQKLGLAGLVNKAQAISKKEWVEEEMGTIIERPKTRRLKHLARDNCTKDENKMGQIAKKRPMQEAGKPVASPADSHENPQLERPEIGEYLNEDLAAEKGNEEKKKSIALKASKHESDEESELDEEEMDMLARSYEETSDDEEHQEMTNLALMAIGDESDDELDEVNDLSTYDELCDAFKELHDNWIKIGKKNACLKKKMVKLTNENESLSAKITCLELDNKTLHDRVALSNEKSSTSHEHLKSYVDNYRKFWAKV